MQIEKFTDKQVRGLLLHMNRVRSNDMNTDIDNERTELNYSLTPYLNGNGLTREEIRKAEWAYYKQRKAELYCYARDDVCTMAGCVVTLPEELIGHPEKAERFFETVTRFLCERYGGEPTTDGRLYPNVVSVTVHYDEKQLDESRGLRGHLHFNWIPAVKIDHEKLMAKKNHVKMMEFYDYKISAKECITKKDLSALHQDLQAYLTANHVEGKVIINPTGGKSVNIPVSQLKEYTERTGRTIDRELLKDLTVDRIVDGLELAREKDNTREWGRSWDDGEKELEHAWTR